MASKGNRNRLALVARNLAAARHLYRVSMVARVESEEDIAFWQHVFSHARPDLKVKSFENHHCWGESLQQTWEALEVCGFDFGAFLKRLSAILYPVLIEMLTTKAAKKNAWNLTELCGVVLSVQANRVEVLEENGRLLIEEIGSKVKVWSDGQMHPGASACEKMRALASEAGLTEETA